MAHPNNSNHQKEKLLKICSINLHNHAESNLAIADYINRNSIDLCFVQEPYVSPEGGMSPFRPNQILRKSSDSPNTRAAIISAIPTIKQIADPCTDTFVAAKIDMPRAPIYLICIYSRPGDPDTLALNLSCANNFPADKCSKQQFSANTQ